MASSPPQSTLPWACRFSYYSHQDCPILSAVGLGVGDTHVIANQAWFLAFQFWAAQGQKGLDAFYLWGLMVTSLPC